MNSISVLCVYFLVAICILAGPFLKMIYHRELEKFEVCVLWCFLSRLSELVIMYSSNVVFLQFEGRQSVSM